MPKKNLETLVDVEAFCELETDPSTHRDGSKYIF